MKNRKKNPTTTEILSPLHFFTEEEWKDNELETTLLGVPFAKQRPRATRKGRFVTIYTPPETKSYEKSVRDQFSLENGYRMLEGPIEAEIIGTFPIPNSVSKKKQQLMLDGTILHTKKPDCDNMGKIALDALNGVAYNDDAQIVKLTISKQYGENPNLHIKLRKITKGDVSKDGS